MDDMERRLQAILRRERQRPAAQQMGFRGLDQIINNRGQAWPPRYHGPLPIPRRAGLFAPAPRRLEPSVERIKVEEDILSYSGSCGDPPGLYISNQSIEHYKNYVEIEILDVGEQGQISIGLVPDKHPLNKHPGVEPNTLAYMAESGAICVSTGRMYLSGPACSSGDRMGIGIQTQQEDGAGDRHTSKVFFSKNGQEVKCADTAINPGQLYPAVGLTSEGEEVMLHLDAVWDHVDHTQMMVDCGEEDWLRLDDVRLNGSTLEYSGRGRTIHDVGLAQAKHALDTTNHYFEFEIVDPGEGCYVAIGLAKQSYPSRRHPGWNEGSIAYHADDGKLFHGSGLGVRFGPKCSLGDVMGCGIFFPPDYENEEDNQSNDEEEEGKDDDEEEEFESGENRLDGLLALNDSEEDEELFEAFIRPRKRRLSKEKGRKVTVFFTRNGKLVGHREVRVPKGGFFPTVGMLSRDEKVRVDLRPLTG